MKGIDFEKIRQDAVDEVTQGMEKNPYGDVIRQYADIASKNRSNAPKSCCGARRFKN